MQKLLFFFLLLLFAGGRSFAQGDCLGYPYVIDLSGFNCGNGLGTICFVTSADWVNYNDCGEYVVELEYETGNFIWTDLGDFYGHSETQDLTVLRHQPSFVSHGLTVGCLEGVIQVPGTVFTIRVVWPSNPNDIIATSTFTIGSPTVIGGPGLTTLLSDAIDNGDLLDQSQAAMQGQNIVIEGTLVVDENYGFGLDPGGVKNEIILRPGARIEVGTTAQGFALGTFHADIHGCGDQWDRILVRGGSLYSGFRTSISDATVALEMLDNSTVDIGRIYFNNNDIGIASFGATPKNIDLNLFTSIFEGITIENGNEGMHFENTNLIDLVANLRVQNMTANGIYLDRADMNGYLNGYIECPVGVRVATSNSNLTLERCEFSYGQAGVVSLGTVNMDIVNNYFHDLDFGVARTTAVANEDTYAEDNTMVNCGMNFLAIVQASNGNILYNTLGADNTNVGVWAIDKGQHKWAVQYNEGMYAGIFNPGGYNVSYLNVNNGRIFNNHFAYASEHNFSVWSGSGVLIGENEGIVCDATNIRVNGSPGNIVYCNIMDGATGIMFNNDCNGTIVRGNDMTSSGHNLSYGNTGSTFASTGPQVYRGNIFDPSTTGSAKAIHFSTEQVAAQSHYQTGFFAGAQGTDLFPFFTSADDEWFLDDDFGNDYVCPPGFAPEDPRDVALHREALNRMDLLDAGVEADYGADIAFDVKLKLFRTLTELQGLSVLTAREQSWYNNLSASDVAPFVDFENDYKTAISFNDLEENRAKQLNDDLLSLRATLNAISWYTLEADKVSIDQGKKAQYDGVLSDIQTKTTQLNDLLKSRYQQLHDAWEDLDNMNEEIGEQATKPGQNLQSANRLLLRRVSPNFSGYSENELQTLKLLARECATTGGEGVYIARALLAETTLSLETYNDDCIGNPDRDRSTTEASVSGLQIAPNPANEAAWVRLPENNTYKALLVFDLLGHEIMRVELAQGQREVRIATSRLAPGVYFLAAEGQKETAQKLVVKR
jgi:hypothetical protein